MAEVKNYVFPNQIGSFQATLSPEEFTLKIPMRTFRVPMGAYKYVFVDPNNIGAECIVAYEVNGKMKNVRFTTPEPDHPAFLELVEDLAASRPGSDLRQLPATEAHAKMGTMSMIKQGVLMGTPIVLAVFMIPMYLFLYQPAAIHAADDGLAEVAVADLPARLDTLETRNLVLTDF